ncbi:MAG: aminotransferase class V-fold PLP-dependent enzyme [Opitutales bacterium]|jgi:cysteine desulfurase
MPGFDHNATAPLRECSRKAWLDAGEQFRANPSALYPAALRAKAALEKARGDVAGLLACEPGRIIFTSGATEANNAVLRRFAGPDARCAVSAVEHPSVLETARALFGERLALLPVDSSGRVDPAAAAEIIFDLKPALVSVMAANSETGVIQPIYDIAGICREAGVPFHCDAVQWPGRLPLGDIARHCAYMSFGAHKFGGPRGAGILLAPAQDAGLRGQFGGRQEGGRRAGTEDVADILAAAAALKEAVAEVADGRAAAQQGFKAAFEARMEALGAELAGKQAPRLPNTSLLLMPRHEGARWVLRLAKLGFETGTGSACSSGRAGPSHVLNAMGIDAARAKRSLRVSSGAATPERDWQALADAAEQVLADLDAEARDSAVVSI